MHALAMHLGFGDACILGFEVSLVVDIGVGGDVAVSLVVDIGVGVDVAVFSVVSSGR